MNRSDHIKRFLWIALVAFTLAVACNAPTLPLPPPMEGAIEARLETGTEMARVIGVQSAVEPYALVTCFNNRTGSGVVGIANGKGGFNIRIEATMGDVIEVWQRIGNDPPSIVVPVP